MNIEDLPEDEKYLFVMTMRLALTYKKVGGNKNDFLKYAVEIWESMEINDFEKLQETVDFHLINILREHWGQKYEILANSNFQIKTTENTNTK